VREFDFESDGATVLATKLDDGHLQELRSAFTLLNFKAGARPFFLNKLVRPLLEPSGCFGQALQSLGIVGAWPVRILAFDKTPTSNWNLGWHQDRVVALKERVDTDGFGNWTIKDGVHHAEAPLELLQRMFNLRLHLDDCNRNNGALKVIAGSHHRGKLAVGQLKTMAMAAEVLFCEAFTGEVVAMKSLAVHASEPSADPKHRRILHIDFCDTSLPSQLNWALDW
jgi:hypothetical protein